MTGLSVLFNLNTEEACYVYGHMESHRRTNEQSINQRYSGLPSPGRQRTFGDLRYTGSTDPTSYTPTYSDHSPRYRPGHGFSDFPRESYVSSPTLSNRGLFSDGDSMSKYTRGYDISNRNTSDYTTKSYDSPRFYDRGKIGTDRPGSEAVSPPFEFGVSYKSPRTHDTSTNSHDITTRTYDRNTVIDDVTTRRSPARITSISDRDVVNKRAHADAPFDRQRQRQGSNDSSSSHSSDKSATTEDRSLFNALKHRYKETAEKQYDDLGARAPFSSWRRSGNFEETASSIAPEAQKEKTKSLERKTYHKESDKSSPRGGSYHEEDSRSSLKDIDRSRSNIKDSSASSEKHGELSPDELIYNFRQALCRHAISEKEKAQELGRGANSNMQTLDIESDATVQRLERLRVARAKIQEQRQSEKVNSQSFATEFKLDKDKKEKSRSESASSISSQKSDRDRVHTEEPVSMLDEQKQKHATKLARQKLVSDDLKAKYMIKRDDDREKTPTNDDDSLSRKRSSRKDRLDEHKEFWSKKTEHDKDTSSIRSKSSESDSVPSMEEMLLGSSKQAKSVVSKKFENVDHSSPFGSVYSKPSTVTTSSVSTSSSSSSVVTSTSPSYHTQPEKIEKMENEKSKDKTNSKRVEIDSKESKVETQDKSDRKYKKYAKAKSLELGALTKKEKIDRVKPAETKDDSKLDSAEDQAQLGRLERIAKYKEERRKQLKTLQERFAAGDSSELPSLFLASKPEEEDSPISRSKSLKVESSDYKQDSAISRSKSLKQDAYYSDRSSLAFGEPHKMPGLRLAELGTQSKPLEVNKGKDVYESDEQKYNTDNIIDKLQALKKLKEEHAKRIGTTEGHNTRYSKEIKDVEVDVGKPVSYASKALLADRLMERPARDKAPSPARERIRFSSIERETGRKTDKTLTQPLSKETEQKSYFEFGTVFTKKERKPEIQREEKNLNIEVRNVDDKENDSGRDSVDLASRVRRKLPSVEDVLGTGASSEDKDKFEKVAQEKQIKKDKEIENFRQYKSDLSKEELSNMTAEQISRRKVAENIEKAKHKFAEDDKHSGVFDASRFELGTVYTGKKTEKKAPPEKSVNEEKAEENLNKQDSLERTRQIMLGMPSETEHVQKKSTVHKVEKQGTEFAQSVIEPQPERKRSHRKDRNLNEEKISQKLDKDVKEENIQLSKDNKGRKPPSSPRSERRKQAEERFGKASEMQGFDFGTSYVKKELVVSKQEEKPKKLTPSEMGSKKEEVKQDVRSISTGNVEDKEKSSKTALEIKTGVIPKTSTDNEKSKIPKSRSRRERHRKREEQESLIVSTPSEVKSSLETQVKLDMKAKTVSTASGKTAEVPSSPRGLSPSRTVAKTLEGVSPGKENISRSTVAATEVKPMIFDVKSSKISTEISRKETPKVSQKIEEVTRVPSIVKAPETPVEKPPERQTSFKSLEVKTSPSAKTLQTPVKQTADKSKQGSSTPKERSVFTFDNISKPKPSFATETVTKQEVKKPEALIEAKPLKITMKPEESNVEVTETKAVKDETVPESLFEMHRKQVEEKLEQKRESIHLEDKPVEKQEKKSEIFELHKKLIAEKLEPRRAAAHVEEKITTRPEIDMIGKHEIDSTIIDMHRKEIEEKLEMRHDHKHEHKEVEKHDKVLRIERYRPDKSKIEKPEQTKTRVEKSLMDTSLDDILSKNVEYLSDLEPAEFKRGRAGGRGKKERPQSTHEHQKGKRILKKKSTSRRSKSEDRSHFKVPGSDEEGEVTRAKVAEDLPRSTIKVKTGHQMTAAKVTSSSCSSKTIQQKTPAVPSQQSSSEKSSDKQSHQSVSSLVTQNLQNDKPVLKQEVQPVYQSREQFDQKQKGNEHQSSSASGIQKSSVSEMLYTGNIKREVSDHLAESSQTEITSGMTSDASDFSERRRFVTRETDIHRHGTDSDQSASSSAMSEGSRKRRKDKTSLRKSKLNESSEDASSSGRRLDSSDDSSKASRVGVRRVSSSRLARESREDKYKGEQQEVFDALKRHDLEISLTKPETSHKSTIWNQSTDKHAINTDHKHLNNIESPRYANKSVLDSNSVLPSRFALPSKVSAAISKLTESSEKTLQEGSSKKTEESHSPRRIRRGNNFSQLLQKFSGSEASSSEKSDSESPRRNKIFLKRQQACAVSSGSSDETRRTPERTQSLKLRNKESPIMEKESVSSVQRSSSFKSDFMKRKFSPEPDNRRRLPNTPNEQSDQPSPELAKVLSKRNEIVAKQQEDGEVIERQRIHDGRVEKSERHYAAVDDEVIADSEVLKMLKSRRKETDSSIEASSVSESESKSQKLPSHVESAFKSDTKTQLYSQSPQSSVESGRERGRLQSQSSVESKLTINLTTTEKEKISHPALHSDKLESAKSKSNVPQLDLASIDTSLDVLKTVTNDLDDTKHSSDQFNSDLSHLKVTSPTQVATFIKAVESDSHSQAESKMRSIHTRVEAEEQKLARSTANETKAETAQRPSSPSSPSQGSIDITSKSEIMRKISTKERTPERQSPKRSGPMKVTTPLNSSGSGLTRTESVGRTESERPKGILKRTPSLKQSGVIVDPELAEVLKSRRQRHDDVDEEEEDQKLTAQEEIQKAREEAQQQNDAAPKEREVSVAERIFQMHTKIEEVKSCPITPKARSGFTTPKSALQRSGNISPRNQFSFEEDTKQSELSGSQLIERLTSLEGRQSNISEKRQKFLHRRQRDDARTRTQPVTLQEIQLADSLETVKKFRSEVIRKASTNVFEALQQEGKQAPAKKTEFPQELRLERRSRGQRHKTLPVTAAELNAIPEDKPSETMNSLKKKFDSYGARDSKADSGILSGSEGEIITHEMESWRSLSVEENIGEDDPVKLSVSAKASMFHQIQESLKERQEKKSASGAKRYIDRKKRERSRTLPITEDEVKLAAEIADKEEEEAKKAEETTVTMATEEGEVDSDELSRQSLKDKVKLFTSIEEDKKAIAAKKGLPPPPKRKNRKLASRFATQPVTYEEVEKAAKISPLACSLVKPPDPEILSGLSVKAQRELIAQHAQQTLSQPSSRSSSRVPSRATSIGDLSTEIINQDSLTVSNTDFNQNQSATETVRPSDVRTKGFEIKKHEESVHSSQTVEKITTSKLDSQKKNILKSQLEEKLSLLHKAPIGLKPNSDVVPTISDINKALHKSESVDSSKSSEVRGILKKEGSFETKKMEVETKSAIKSSELTSEIVEEVDSDGNVIEGFESSGDNLDSDEGLLDVEGEKVSTDTPVKRGSKARRRFNRDRKLEQERYKTQPTEGSSESPDSSRAKKKYSGRHFTQPVTPDEKQEAEIATDMPEITKTGSIHDRLNALKKSGDEEWKKRVSRPVDLDKLDRRSASPELTPPTIVKMREKKGLDTQRPSSIADRLSALDNAQEGWRDRVGETDVKKFTIEHKITSSGQTVGESPLVTRLRGKTPRKERSQDSDTSENSDLISPTSPTKPLPKEVVCADLPAEMLVQESPSPLAKFTTVEEEKTSSTVAVPEVGAELDNFFQSSEKVTVKSEELDVSVDDFNELFMSANDMLETTKRAKPKRRYNTKSRNPLKTMSACLEVKSEYTEVIHGVAERELKSVKVAALQQNSGFAVEALAGLASMENFSKVELRKTDSNGAGSSGSNSRLEPYLPLMLIHIKGRRKVQCRLVEPKAESVNSGDCYVLVTPDRIINWVGDYCNVIEKAKAADVCDFIKQKRDLGCKQAREVTFIEEKKGRLGNARHFWDLLGGHKPYMASGPPEEDELYETHIVETNMIYKLEDNKLVPEQDYWGNQPKYEMLQSSQVYVFDFGSELYLWQGKAVPQNQRKISLKLAQQLWNQGYDYSKCEINPVSPLRTAEEDGGAPVVSDKRPDWALFGKVNQNMETILFREKFADWPDTSRIIKVKSQEEVNTTKFDLADLKAYNAKLMVQVDTKPVSMVLEGSHVGRGTKWEQDMDGFIQEQEIQTRKVRVWHVLEYDHYEIEEHSYGQFHEGDTYVVRWQYMIVNAGMKSLKGQASRFSQMGRERCAYFFWQGKSSTINEKGASALMTVELDEERGPQVRVSEGKEPPCFLNLFKGRAIIHIGKREEEETNTQGPWRFYCLRNEYENEMCLIEVPKDISNLRSVSSCLLLNVVTGKLMVWHGCKSPEHTRKLAKKAADNLKERCPLEVGLHKGAEIDIYEIDEGSEKTDFWRMFNVHIGDRTKYHCLLDNPESFSHTLRLFHMTSVSGIFEAQEILNPTRTPELPTKFPALQTDLYMAQQPTLFLIDNGHEVYLWQGWWPEGDEDQENVLTGSAQTRFTVDRKCAMETTLAYCTEINPDSPPPAYMVYAGLEPLSFTNLFPFWTVDENVREINLRDGKTEGELVPVQDLLKKLTKTRYTFAELLETPLPEGVDPLKLESYLSDEEFEAVLEMTREEFYKLPGWKQQKLKQQVELF